MLNSVHLCTCRSVFDLSWANRYHTDEILHYPLDVTVFNVVAQEAFYIRENNRKSKVKFCLILSLFCFGSCNKSLESVVYCFWCLTTERLGQCLTISLSLWFEPRCALGSFSVNFNEPMFLGCWLHTWFFMPFLVANWRSWDHPEL